MIRKSVVIIDTDDINNIELVELKPLRNMQVLKGTFEEVMNMKTCDDIIKVELKDENTLISPMEEIKKKI
ncbi:MAG: exonuclease SbcCD subunit D C-terminal domain-containing protein [Clostridium sp.]|nr:MAG: exonuclease SbcCD subunit D C-terminal domain-containing protein [Clostridium sp.]